MLDTDSKLYTHAHVAGLKRLSARASAGPRAAPPAAAAAAPCRALSLSFSHLGRGVIAHLRARGVEVAPPLSEEHFHRLEATFSFCFPPDLQGILREGLPVGAAFPDWSDPRSQQLRLRVGRPALSICQAVERGSFWWQGWGARPRDLHHAALSARAALKKAPMLLPLYGHCYVPASPSIAGNPVFFIHQSEAFLCASDIADFFLHKLFLLMDRHAFPLPSQLPSLDLTTGLQPSPGDGQEQDRPLNRQNSLGSDSWGWRSRSFESAAGRSDATPCRTSVSSVSEQDRRVSKSSASSASSSGDRTSCESGDEVSAQKISSAGLLSLFSPSGSGKAARRIEFWSDFIEKSRIRRTPATMPAQNPAEPTFDNDNDNVVDNDDDDDNDDDESNSENESKTVSCQMEKILDDVSARLRTGGWKEADISDIVDASSPTSARKIQPLDRQSVLEDLAFHLDYLSASLRKAGWSVEDVAETLSFDLSLYENQRKPRLKLTPRLAARIGPLAAYVANA